MGCDNRSAAPRSIRAERSERVFDYGSTNVGAERWGISGPCSGLPCRRRVQARHETGASPITWDIVRQQLDCYTTPGDPHYVADALLPPQVHVDRILNAHA